MGGGTRRADGTNARGAEERQEGRGKSVTVTVIPDTIRFERTGPRSFQNVTAGDHIFHSGTVRGEILGSSKHGFFLLFVGAGTNTNKLLAYINQAFGKSLFDEQAAKVKYQLKLTCGG